MPERLGNPFTGNAAEAENSPKKNNKNLREMLFLAEQSVEGGVKVVPGKEWAFHYAATPEARTEKLEGLKSGKYEPAEVYKDLKPDALVYKIEDLETLGLEAVKAKILDATSQVAQKNYLRYAEFVANMKGLDVDLPTVDSLYNGLTQNRIQKKMREAYGSVGKMQIDSAMLLEAEANLANFANLSKTDKVLTSLKLDWLCEDLALIGTDQRDAALAQMSGEERALYNKLSKNFRDFVQDGNEEAYKDLTADIRQGLPAVQKKTEPGDQPSESMQELEKELEQFEDQAVPPGSPEDPAIPPEDEDEYHTPEQQDPGQTESKEKQQTRPIFEIQPPLAGYYVSGRKSYYDIDAKTWSKKKQLSPYSGGITAQDRHSISGTTAAGVKSLPIPNSFALDTASLKYEGAPVEIFRDQNGCFYIQSQGPSKFSIEFGKEDQLFTGPVITEDLAPIYRGLLSDKTEAQIARLAGSNVQKAKQAQGYVLANHFYPGGGDLKKAGALQLKLRNGSTGDNYLQNIDASEYLECYSAENLFIAMVRKAGVPARLVVGHRAEGAVAGKTQITESTGHAWSEIWDGAKWVRFDATPAPKPEDKTEKKDQEDSGQEQEQKESAPEAEDGGEKQPGQQQPQEKGQEQGKQEGQQEPGGEPQDGQPQQGQPGQQPPQSKDSEMPEASDSDMQQAEQELQEAQEKMEEMSKKKDELKDKMDKAKDFTDLDKLQKELEKSDMLEDMKEDLEEKLDAKEKKMKEDLKDHLDQMMEDGFLDEKRRDELEEILDKKDLKDLDRIKQQIDVENRLFNEYENIREEVMPLVDHWFDYFVSHLPKQDEVEVDEDSRTRQGSFDRRSIQKARNLIFGTIRNPRVIRASIKPLFLASIMVDVSGSMDQGSGRIENARKLLIFYSELFSRIQKEFGYIRFAVSTFADSIKEIKTYDQKYDSPQSNLFSDGEKATVKVRLMKNLKAKGGTDMLTAVKKAAEDLNRESSNYPDYASAFYLVGDGDDTNGNSDNVRKFLEMDDRERGFGDHMRSAIMLGDESQRQTLADIFGDEHTAVAPDFEALVEQAMDRFENDITEYLKQKTI